MATVEEAMGASPMGPADGGFTGVIIPPPEMKVIVDKAATFVARNGPAFEMRIRDNERNNAKFSFLNPTDAYHAYYRQRLQQLLAEAGAPVAESAPASATTTGSPAAAIKGAQAQAAGPAAVVREPPPWEFLTELPVISAADLDVVRLTAQFVARNGRQFLATLARMEGKNHQFDFLRQNHSLFGYFTKLVEHYTKVLVPSKATKERLRENVANRTAILDRVTQRVAWLQLKEKERAQSEIEAEKERQAFLSIDWQDFVVAGAITFTPEDDQTELPTPATVEQLRLRSMAEKRLAALPAVAPGAATTTASASAGDEQEEAEMDVDEDVSKPPPGEQAAEPSAPGSTAIKIRKDYVPKAMQGGAGKAEQPSFVFRGETVSAEEANKHLRIELLDSKWKEQRELMLQRNKEALAGPQIDVSANLARFAEKRKDIFGGGTTVTAPSDGESTEAKAVRAWDGHSDSVDKVTALAQQRAMEEMARPRAAEPEQPIAGPRLGVPTSQPYAAPAFPMPVPAVPTANWGANTFLPPAPPMGMQFPGMAPGGIMPGMMPVIPQQQGMSAQGMPLMLPGAPPLMPGMMPPPPMGQPDAKRQRMDEPAALISEADFLAANKHSVNIEVAVPSATEGAAGTVEMVTVPLTASVGSVKETLSQRVGLAANKFNLKHDALGFLKDAQTMAALNMPSHVRIQLVHKERGGRRK